MTPEPEPGAAVLSDGDRALVADLKARERMAAAEARNIAKVEALKAARRPRDREPGTLRGSSPVRFGESDDDPADAAFARALGY